jgi:hypothetical protein
MRYYRARKMSRYTNILAQMTTQQARVHQATPLDPGGWNLDYEQLPPATNPQNVSQVLGRGSTLFESLGYVHDHQEDTVPEDVKAYSSEFVVRTQEQTLGLSPRPRVHDSRPSASTENAFKLTNSVPLPEVLRVVSGDNSDTEVHPTGCYQHADGTRMDTKLTGNDLTMGQTSEQMYQQTSVYQINNRRDPANTRTHSHDVAPGTELVFSVLALTLFADTGALVFRSVFPLDLPLDTSIPHTIPGGTSIVQYRFIHPTKPNLLDFVITVVFGAPIPSNFEWMFDRVQAWPLQASFYDGTRNSERGDPSIGVPRFHDWQQPDGTMVEYIPPRWENWIHKNAKPARTRDHDSHAWEPEQQPNLFNPATGQNDKPTTLDRWCTTEYKKQYVRILQAVLTLEDFRETADTPSYMFGERFTTGLFYPYCALSTSDREQIDLCSDSDENDDEPEPVPARSDHGASSSRSSRDGTRGAEGRAQSAFAG